MTPPRLDPSGERLTPLAVQITEDQRAKLERVARARSSSLASVIRSLIDRLQDPK